MSLEERQELARALAAIDLQHPMADPRVLRRRRVALLFLTSVCLVLAAWTGILASTLPPDFKIDHWGIVWVGLDIAELAGLAVTVWASWKQRQVIIVCMVFTGTLLICDAWFDIALDLGTPAIWTSVASAVFLELPLAFFLIHRVRLLLRITLQHLFPEGDPQGRPMKLTQMPLVALLARPPADDYVEHGDLGDFGENGESGESGEERGGDSGMGIGGERDTPGQEPREPGPQ